MEAMEETEVGQVNVQSAFPQFQVWGNLVIANKVVSVVSQNLAEKMKHGILKQTTEYPS
jgi:translation initiation factor 6 (eIF-6)